MNRWHARLEFKPADCWIGVFWQWSRHWSYAGRRLDIWICVIPMCPVHLWRDSE